jgi:hypothetical protein
MSFFVVSEAGFKDKFVFYMNGIVIFTPREQCNYSQNKLVFKSVSFVCLILRFTGYSDLLVTLVNLMLSDYIFYL